MSGGLELEVDEQLKERNDMGTRRQRELEKLLGMIAAARNSVGRDHPCATTLNEAGLEVKSLIYREAQRPPSAGISEKLGQYLTEAYSQPELPDDCTVRVKSGFLKVIKAVFDYEDKSP